MVPEHSTMFRRPDRCSHGPFRCLTSSKLCGVKNLCLSLTHLSKQATANRVSHIIFTQAECLLAKLGKVRDLEPLPAYLLKEVIEAQVLQNLPIQRSISSACLLPSMPTSGYKMNSVTVEESFFDFDRYDAEMGFIDFSECVDPLASLEQFSGSPSTALAPGVLREASDPAFQSAAAIQSNQASGTIGEGLGNQGSFVPLAWPWLSGQPSKKGHIVQYVLRRLDPNEGGHYKLCSMWRDG